MILSTSSKSQETHRTKKGIENKQMTTSTATSLRLDNEDFEMMGSSCHFGPTVKSKGTNNQERRLALGKVARNDLEKNIQIARCVYTYKDQYHTGNVFFL